MAEWSEKDTDLEQKTETEESQDYIDVFEENEIDDSRFKAQEVDFYGNQQIYNSRLDDYEKDMNCEYLSEEERKYAKQKYDEVYVEKRDAIDAWKEKHGQYDEERAELRIGGKKKSEEIEEQESYDIKEQVLEGGSQESQTADVEIVEQDVEMKEEAQEAQAEVEVEVNEITVEQSNNEPNSDYKVMIDGEEFDPNKNPLEGTKELIGHSDLDDAYWANDVHSAEKMKEVADKMQAGDYNMFDFAGPMNDMNEIKYESNKNEYEINAFRKVNQWSRDSYTEEYNPEDFN